MSEPKRLVLVVDDDEELRLLMRHFLSKAGYDVVEAGDGELGLSLAGSRAPDLIVLDLMMPKLDGFGVLRGLQAAGLSMPVIVVTGYSAEANAELLTKEPLVRGLMAKPVDYDALVAAIRAALKG